MPTVLSGYCYLKSKIWFISDGFACSGWKILNASLDITKRERQLAIHPFHNFAHRTKTMIFMVTCKKKISFSLTSRLWFTVWFQIAKSSNNV